VACFFAGGGAAKFMKDYAAAGLKGKIPLYGSGFLTEGVLDAAGRSRRWHCHDHALQPTRLTPRATRNSASITPRQFKLPARRVCGAGLRLGPAADLRAPMRSRATWPMPSRRLYKAMEGAVIDSPRGKWTMSKAHNPVQDIYLRVVENKENKVIGVAAKALSDSGAGCKMG
jgi:branched-chain amino acid transport system substrate-binding protein